MHRQKVEVKQGIRGRRRMRRRAAAIGLVLAVGVAGCGIPEPYHEALDGDGPIVTPMVLSNCPVGDDLEPDTDCHNQLLLNNFFLRRATSQPLIEIARENGLSCKRRGKRTYCELTKKILSRPNLSGYPPRPGAITLYTLRINFITGAPAESADLQTALRSKLIEKNIP